MGILQMHLMKLMIKPFELATSICQNVMFKQLQVFGFIWFIKRKKKKDFQLKLHRKILLNPAW